MSSKRFPTPSVLVIRELMLPMQNEKTTAPITCGHVSQPYRVNTRHHCRVCSRAIRGTRLGRRPPVFREWEAGGRRRAPRQKTCTCAPRGSRGGCRRSPWSRSRLWPSTAPRRTGPAPRRAWASWSRDCETKEAWSHSKREGEKKKKREGERDRERERERERDEQREREARVRTLQPVAALPLAHRRGELGRARVPRLRPGRCCDLAA